MRFVPLRFPLRVSLALLIAAVLCGVALAPGDARAVDSVSTGLFEGTTVHAGSALPTNTLGSGTGVTNLQGAVTGITMSCSKANSCTPVVAASGTLRLSGIGRPLAFAISYTNSRKWTITINPNPAASAPTSSGSTGIDPNAVRGTIVASGGTVTEHLVVRVASLATAGGSAGDLQRNLLAGHTQLGSEYSLRLPDATVLPVTSASYTDASNWRAEIPAAHVGTMPGSVTGWAQQQGGVGSSGVTVTGVTMAGTPVTFTGTLTPTGIVATATVSNVTLQQGVRHIAPGSTSGPVAVVVSTATATVRSGVATVGLQGAFVVGHAQFNATGTYSDAANWEIDMVAQGAGTPTPANNSTLDLNSVEGEVRMVDGNLSTELAASGVTVGDASYDMVVTATPSGFQASLALENLHLGGVDLHEATVTLNNSAAFLTITADITSEMGDIYVTVSATGHRQGAYDMEIYSAGTVAVGPFTGDFQFEQFAFDWRQDNVSNAGCVTIDTSVGGTMVIRGTEMHINNAELRMACTDVQLLDIDLAASHTSTRDNLTTAAGLGLRWADTPGSYDATWGPNGAFHLGAIPYSKGFFGTIDLSRTLQFDRDYTVVVVDYTFSKAITIGMGTLVAYYQPPSSSTWTKQFNVTGYVSADRVSASFGCDFISATSIEFSCGGAFRMNPEHLDDNWYYSWSGF